MEEESISEEFTTVESFFEEEDLSSLEATISSYNWEIGDTWAEGDDLAAGK